MHAMKFLRSKYVNNPVVAAIILVAGSAVLSFLDDLTDPIFTPRESVVVGKICDVIAAPGYLLLWLPHSKSRVIQVAEVSLIFLFIIGAWAAVFNAARAFYWRIRGLKR
jgi:hypothetical protein